MSMTREISPQEKLHWGASSCYLTYGANLVIVRKTLDILLSKLALVVRAPGRSMSVKYLGAASATSWAGPHFGGKNLILILD